MPLHVGSHQGWSRAPPDLVQGNALHHAVPARAFPKEGKDLVLAAVVQRALHTLGAPHVQAVARDDQLGHPAGGHVWQPC